MTDFAARRKTMVEAQVQPSDVTDRRILRAMLEVPRELFAPRETRATAYMDGNLVVARAQAGSPARVLLAPRIFAKLIQALELGEADQVLEIGAATGYGAAVLAKIARTVVALESDPVLAEQATANLRSLGIANVAVVNGALAGGHPGEAPYDAILIEGAVTEIPAPLLDQLKDGGRLAAVVIEGSIGRATQVRRLGGTFDALPLFEAGAPLLPGFERKPAFVF